MIRGKFVIFLGAWLISTISFAQKYEAEDAQLTGLTVSKQLAGYSGTGYVTGFDNDGDKVVFKFTAETAGKFELFIGYAASSGDKNNFVYANGDNIGNILFPKNSKFSEISAGNIQLKAGENTISIEKSWGWIDVDYIRINNAAAPTSWNISTLPVNKNASVEAVSMYKFLLSNFGKTTFAGQFQNEDLMYTNPTSEIQLIKTYTGKYPSLYGTDFIDYSPSRVAHGSTSKAVEDIIAWHKTAKGMVTLTWHWNAPTDLYNTAENQWWSGFYTRATSFDIAWVMNNPDSEKYKLMISDIDAIAVQLKKLQAENIPILWRPLHEAEGAWFWWGAKGPDACVKLWKLLYDRLTNHHGINNLIWVWTTTDSPSALNWYPGNDFVDILGVDVYLNDGDYSASSSMFDNLRTKFEGKKMLTMSEDGTIPDPEKMYSQDATWLYFCTWVGDFVTGGKKNTKEHFNYVFNHEKVTTLDELPANWSSFVGVNDINLKKKLKYYPNPVSNQLSLNFTNSELPSEITVLSTSGKRILTLDRESIQQEMEVPFNDLMPGMYIVQFKLNSSTQSIKVIKQ